MFIVGHVCSKKCFRIAMLHPNFGIAPYINESLRIKVPASPFFTVSFDESLNSGLEK